MKIQENYFYRLDNSKDVKVIWKKYDKANILEIGVEYPTAIVYLDRLSGILLTEEWLLNFGFIKCENEYWFEKDILSLNLIGTINIQGRKYSECVIQHGIKYVHQLQNLFFALTGDELAVSNSVS